MCIFCKIIKKEIPSDIIYEDKNTLAFYDINPKAPVHFLVIPKVHIIESVNDINETNSGIAASCFETIAKTAAKLGLKNGYRIVNNCGEDGGQTVDHLHFHVLGGQKFTDL